MALQKSLCANGKPCPDSLVDSPVLIIPSSCQFQCRFNLLQFRLSQFNQVRLSQFLGKWQRQFQFQLHRERQWQQQLLGCTMRFNLRYLSIMSGIFMEHYPLCLGRYAHQPWHGQGRCGRHEHDIPMPCDIDKKQDHWDCETILSEPPCM